jgi:hypothetical protein
LVELISDEEISETETESSTTTTTATTLDPIQLGFGKTRRIFPPEDLRLFKDAVDALPG